jgi:hypothetical protein
LAMVPHAILTKIIELAGVSFHVSLNLRLKGKSGLKFLVQLLQHA